MTFDDSYLPEFVPGSISEKGGSTHPRKGMDTIETYEAILAITDRMLQAARRSDWDKLVALELDCKQLTGQLIERHAHQVLTDEQQKKKIKLIHQILERDAEIRAVTEPWMTHLQNMLASNSRKRKLRQSYQSDM